MASNLTPERATERAFERAWVIWPLLLIAVGDGELTQDLLYCPPIERQGFCRWRRCGGGGSHGGGPGEPSWLRYCNVTFSPGRISQWADRMAARLAPDSGRPARRRSTTFRDGWTAWRGGPHRTPLRLGTRSRHGRRAPRGAPLALGGSGKSVARCHRTVLAYWKFESISLQQGVRCELDPTASAT